MKQATLAKWLKAIIVGIGLCGLVIYILVLPICGSSIISQNPEFAYWRYPWLIFLWLTGIPCYIVLVFGWKIAANISADHSFSHENARLLKYISILAIADTGFFFLTNIVFLLLNMNHPGVVLASLVVACIGVAISVTAAALSHLVTKAADLQEQSDLTI